MLAYQKRYLQAESTARAALQIDPSFPVARAQLARALVMLGKSEEALSSLPPFGSMLGSADAGFRGAIFALAGQPDRARHEIQSLTAQNYVASDAIAMIYAALGEKDQAIRWLQKALAAHAFTLVFIKVEPMFDSLRDDPRFKAILARTGLQ